MLANNIYKYYSSKVEHIVGSIIFLMKSLCHKECVFKHCHCM